MNTSIRQYVGLDVHKETIAIAHAPAGSGAPRFVGTTPFSVSQVTKALRKLDEPQALSLGHKAGPCGYGLARDLNAKGYACIVVAPSRVARQPADKIKTDRRDALLLARLHRAEELSPIVIPDPHDEAIRDLVRAREDAGDTTAARVNNWPHSCCVRENAIREEKPGRKSISSICPV